MLDENHPIFGELFNVVDNVMKIRVAEGAGIVKSATPISLPIENRLWNTGVLGEHNPKQLADTIFYLLGVNLALRGGVEHKSLRRPGFYLQITISEDGDGKACLVYREDPKSRTNQGGLRCKFKTPRVVYVYPNVDRSKCPVALHEKYVNLLPKTQKCPQLYL